jgi:hypothetical protein
MLHCTVALTLPQPDGSNVAVGLIFMRVLLNWDKIFFRSTSCDRKSARSGARIAEVVNVPASTGRQGHAGDRGSGVAGRFLSAAASIWASALC